MATILVSALLVLTFEAAPATPQTPPRVEQMKQSELALRQPKEGESVIEGLLQRVECPRGGPVRFTMRVGDTVERFEARRLGDVEYIAHTPDFKGPMTCGGRGKGDRVRLTWKMDGKVRRPVAVEFLPASPDR
ncbi:MAG TPA: hypothetical protein VGD94_02645 [Vicinamibacterales bacterium]